MTIKKGDKLKPLPCWTDANKNKISPLYIVEYVDEEEVVLRGINDEISIISKTTLDEIFTNTL